MERELAKLTSDMEHVKKTTEEIKVGIAEVITQIGKMAVDAESLRGRIRELEHKTIELEGELKIAKSDILKNKSAIWKISGILAVIANVAGVSIGKFF